MAEVIRQSMHPQSTGMAAFHSSTDGRRIVGSAVGRRLEIVAKMRAAADSGIENESLVYAQMAGHHLLPTLAFDGVILGYRLLVTRAVPGRPTFNLETALTVCCELADMGITHGDLAPWNVISDRRTLKVIDWECSKQELLPLKDLMHYMYQSSRLAHRMTLNSVAWHILSPDGVCARYQSVLGPVSNSARVNAAIAYLEQAPNDDFRKSLKELVGES